MTRHILVSALGAGALMLSCASGRAATVAELQKQIDELKAIVQGMAAERGRRGSAPAARVPLSRTDAGTLPAAGRAPNSAVTRTDLGSLAQPAPRAALSRTDAGTFPAAGRPPEGAVRPADYLAPFALERPETWGNLFAQPTYEPASDVPRKPELPKTWFERLSIRGYTQLRVNEFLDGDRLAPGNLSRFRSVHDSGINEFGGFTFRRVRLIIQGDIHERVFIYIQPDFGTTVNNQSATTEPRLNYGQLRDAYVDVFLDEERAVKFRAGQQKIPYGWENLQSSQNRLALDRTDAINSGIPSERDIGLTLYYTPPEVQRTWDRLAKDGQKLFGNYGAFGVGVYNGQTINRPERNRNVQVVGMATWPFELGGLSSILAGQVLELGASAYANQFRPEIRTGGVSPVSYDDNRVGLHAILYPQPFGLQAEYNWGEGPEFDLVTRTIQTKPLEGGYIQAMYRVDHSPIGQFYPYVRLQTYRGGWKVALNAARLETDELEVGIEFQPIKPIELTLAYTKGRRREADERRIGQADADLFRAQLQWNY